MRKAYLILMVVEMDRALQFYAGAFSAFVSLHTPYWSELVVAGATIALHPGRTGPDGYTGLGLEVDDLEAALEAATSFGARIIDPPRARPEERIRIAQIADTEGNILSIAETTR